MIDIPRIRAREFIRRMEEARTKPALFRCQVNGRLDEYIVKFKGGLGFGIVCELVAALLGRRLGLPIPQPAIVEIDNALIGVINEDTIKEILLRDSGPHFGSQLQVPGFSILPVDFTVLPDMIPVAIDIFAFDMLIQNIDITHQYGRGKPNCLSDDHRYAVIDHELSFSFLDDLNPFQRLPWLIRDWELAKYHIFYKQIRLFAGKNTLSFDRFLARVRGLSDDELDLITDLIPKTWSQLDPDKAEMISSYIYCLRNNTDSFRKGLLEVFA